MDPAKSLVSLWCVLLGFSKMEGVLRRSVKVVCGKEAQYRWDNCVLVSLFTPGTGDVWISLRGTTYQNNSLVTLEDIGERYDALICVTNLTACCRSSYSGPALGNWYFPNESRVPSYIIWWDFFRTRSQMVVRLNRRRGGEDGIYHCVIPDSMNVIQNIYIGVYMTSTGELYICTFNWGIRPAVHK